MKTYYVIFEYHGKNICGVWKRADGKEKAIMDAEFALMCHYPNVKYDNCYITAIKD